MADQEILDKERPGGVDMEIAGYDYGLNFAHESVETLLLMAVLGQEAVREAALSELQRRKALAIESADLSSVFMTNISGIC